MEKIYKNSERENEVKVKVNIGRSFNEVLESVKAQVEFECFDSSEKENANGLCLTIAEVMCLDPDVYIQIGGKKYPAKYISAIYAYISHEMMSWVIAKLKDIPYRVPHPKSYRRTVLYNAVFDYDFSVDNDFAVNSKR